MCYTLGIRPFARITVSDSIRRSRSVLSVVRPKLKVHIILAHPDDELLFGWPVLLDASFERHLLICSSDEANTSRSWCAKRRYALARVCELIEVSHECLAYDSDFYRFPNRPRRELTAFCDEVRARVLESRADLVFTHNPHGEYGHPDHRLLFQIVAESVRVGTLLFTDICVQADWPFMVRDASASQNCYYRDQWGSIRTLLPEQEALVRRGRKIYQTHGCWTWNSSLISQCRLFRL